ncbi:tRNA:m(4)X modification enzyme TRM13 [Chamberlinius hualienensis]
MRMLIMFKTARKITGMTSIVVKMAEDLGTSHCALYIARKKRYCKMLPNPGEIYCSQHLPVNIQLQCGKKRILCPLDNKHSCYEDELDDHLTRCNAREKPKPIFYQANINSGNDFSSAIPESVKIAIKDVPTEKLIEVLTKLETIYSEKVDPVSTPISFPSTSLIETSSDGNSVNLKHTKQVASMLALLEHYELVKDGNAMVEFGAGRLTHWIIKEIKPTKKSRFILIDRASQRHKFDNKYKDTEEIQIQRIKIDIEHLDLKKVSSIHTCDEMIVTSKHLCGVATDFALRCITNYQLSNQKLPEHLCKFKGALIALCCHHRCEWKHYVGKEFLIQNGFKEEDFNILLSITSWATCGTQSNKDSMDEPHGNLCEKQKLGINEDEQTKYGIKSKRLLDQGRIDYLNKNRVRGTLVYYTDKATSLENVAILLLPQET